VNNTRGKIIAAAAAAAAFGLGAGVGAASNSSTAAAGPAVTKTIPVPGATQVVKVPVPGPTKVVYKTRTVQAPPPAPGQQIAVYNGSGNQVTPAFNIPDSGNYIVKWSYSGNNADGSADNFIIENTGDGDGSGLPDDIQVSGSGSTEVTGSSAATDALNVQSTGSWTITVVSA